MSIPSDIREKVVVLITEHIEPHTLQVLLKENFPDLPLQDEITAEKYSREYGDNLVRLLFEQSSSNKKAAVLHLLDMIRTTHNQDAVIQAKIEDLIAQIEAEAPSQASNTAVESPTPPPPNERIHTRFTCRTCLNLTIASFIVAVLGLVVGMLQLIPEGDRGEIIAKLFNQQPTTSIPTATVTPVPTSTPIPAQTMRREIHNLPERMIIISNTNGAALWGIDAEGSLFALDTQTGELLSTNGATTTSVADLDGDAIRPVDMYHDGKWLWIADAVDNQLLALDPLSHELIGQWQLGNRPTAITGVSTLLWVTQNNGTVQSVISNSSTGSLSEHCSVPGGVGSNPGPILIEGESVLWIASGDVNSGQVQRVNLQTCRLIGEPIDIPAKPSSLAILENRLWFVANGILGNLNTNSGEVRFVSTIDGLKQVIADNFSLWLLSDSALINYDPNLDRVINHIVMESTPVFLTRFGAQVWVLTEDRALIRYLFPDAIHYGIVDIASSDGNLWLIDNDANLCVLYNDFDCSELEIDSDPIALAESGDPKTLWLATSDGSIWRVDTNERKAERLMTLAQGAPTYLIEDGGIVWASDGLSWIVTLDPEQATLDTTLVMPINFPMPDILSSTGGTLWAFSNDNVFNIQLSHRTLIQETAPFILPFTPQDAITTRDGHFLLGNGTVVQLSLLNGSVGMSTGTGSNADRITVVGNTIWVAESASGALYRLQP